MSLTLADLRYLKRLVQYDYYETMNYQQSERVEGKLKAMIADMKGGDVGMAAAKTSKAAPKKPSKPVGKKVAKKK